MHHQRALPLPPRVHRIERAHAPVVQARHAGEDAHHIARGDGVRLENREGVRFGVGRGVEVVRQADVGEVEKGCSAFGGGGAKAFCDDASGIAG